MKHYRSSRFNASAGIAAAAMMALTLVVAVVVPMSVAPSGPDSAMLTGPARNAGAPIEVAIIPSRIEVVGTRDTTLAERQHKPRG
jgi:hypothetical protein